MPTGPSISLPNGMETGGWEPPGRQRCLHGASTQGADLLKKKHDKKIASEQASDEEANEVARLSPTEIDPTAAAGRRPTPLPALARAKPTLGCWWSAGGTGGLNEL